MKKVIIASQNPVKIEAVRVGFQRMFPREGFSFEGISAESGVSDQPMSRSETLLGAQNRAEHAAVLRQDADYTIGIEGGVELSGDSLEVFAWVVVKQGKQSGKAQTGVFYLPQEVSRLIKEQGMELGDADDLVFGRSNSKQQGGSIGLLTDNTLTRTDYYTQAVILALIPFKKPEFTW